MAGSRSALAAAVALVVLAACTLGCGSSPTARPLVLTVDTGHPGAVLPADFLGLSFESSVLDSPLLDPNRTNVAALLKNLGVGHLRFGGNSLDRVTAWQADDGSAPPPWAHAEVTPAGLRRLGELSTATGWRIDLGVTLGHFDPAAAAGEAATANRLIGAGLEAVEIGNEPDLFAHDPTLRPGGYGYGDYIDEVGAYRRSIAAAAPGAAIAGPDTAGTSWLAAYGRDERTGLSFLTQHFYPLTRCAGGHPTIADLASAATTALETKVAATAVAAARADGLGVRLDETNSASCGGQDGVSNTLASALWMVRYLLLAGRAGVAGVDVQGGLAACRGYTPLCVPGATGASAGTAPGIDPVADASLGAGPPDAGRLAAQPDYYGLLLVHLVTGGRWLPVHWDRGSPVSAFALQMPDGSVRVILDNPDPSFSGRVTVDGPRGRATSLRLTGPSLGATSGIRFGGATVAADGSWKPAEGQPAPAAAGRASIPVTPSSAALITFPAVN